LVEIGLLDDEVFESFVGFEDIKGVLGLDGFAETMGAAGDWAAQTPPLHAFPLPQAPQLPPQPSWPQTLFEQFGAHAEVDTHFPPEQVWPFKHFESVSTQAEPSDLHTRQPSTALAAQTWVASQVIVLLPSNGFAPSGTLIAYM
jgi:hypothetical protein